MKNLLFLLSLVFVTTGANADFTVENIDGGVAVKLDGKLFAQYHEDYETKPVWHPIIGPDGRPMTRPLGEGDHPHHASFFFTHGDVDGIDFWHKKGPIEHLEYLEKSGGDDKAVVTTRSAWKTKEGTVIGEEIRRSTFHVLNGQHVIDVDVTWTAGAEAVEFGATKEGGFGLRVPPQIVVKSGGKIINDSGEENERAWGQEAAWVDYYGKIDDATVGVAMLTHPKNVRHPVHWHVRTYGLFAAAPFMKQGMKLPTGAKINLHHRVIFHTGDVKEAKIAEQYEAYSKSEVTAPSKK